MIKWNPRLIEARDFNREAHDSIHQVRKYTGAAYWTHTEEVAEIISEVTDDEDIIIASFAHDQIEDVFPINPYYSLELIKIKYGERTALLVDELTDRYVKEHFPNLNRAQRKKLERRRISKISNDSKTIKLADLISNTKSIVEHDKKFALTYLREKYEMLPSLVGGNETLLKRAFLQCVEAMNKLNIIP